MNVGNSENSNRLFTKLYEIYFPTGNHQAPQMPVDQAEQRRKQEELLKLKMIKSFEAQQQKLMIWRQIYWQQLQQVNQIVQNPHHPATNIPRKRIKRPEKRKKAYLVAAATMQAVDSWAWRKYGQKPIKGCSYPRSYYTCSSSKGCKAKKQVEKILVDPEIYMVSYKGEHVHLNPVQPTQLPRSVLASLIGASVPFSDQPATPSDDVEEDEGLLIPNLMVDQDMMRSMEELKNYYSSSAPGSTAGPGFN